MTEKTFSTLAAAIFGVVAVLHLVRILIGWSGVDRIADVLSASWSRIGAPFVRVDKNKQPYSASQRQLLPGVGSGIHDQVNRFCRKVF